MPQADEFESARMGREGGVAMRQWQRRARSLAPLAARVYVRGAGYVHETKARHNPRHCGLRQLQ